MDKLDLIRRAAIMPSEEDMSRNALARYSAVAWTYIDQWPQSWRDMSIPTKLIEMNRAECMALKDIWEDEKAAQDAKGLLRGLADLLDHEMDWEWHFIRLNSRSPKDAVFPFQASVACDGKSAIRMLQLSFDRTCDDAVTMARAGKPCCIALRQWMPELFNSQEFEYRCFIKDGDLIAISQYRYDLGAMHHLQDKKFRARVWAESEEYARKVLIDAKHDSLVMDLWLPPHSDSLLIEVNPYGLSDPCCAESYQRIENEGGFFFVDSAKCAEGV